MKRAGMLVAALVPGLVAVATGATPTYEREIAPILRTYCSGCHNDRDAEADFSVERFASLRKGGAEAGDPIVPGDAAASTLVKRITSADADHMPPADEPQVPAADLATLEAWIAAGAPGPTVDASLLETLAVPALAAYGGMKPVTALALAPGGGRLAVARGRTVEVLDVVNGIPGSVVVTMPDPPGNVLATHFSRDGSRLVISGGVTGLRGVAEIRDAATGRLVRAFGGHRDLVYDAELSPDETLLATAGYDRSIRLWNTADGSLVRSIDVHNGAVFDLAWHPSGKVLASASADETVKLWRAADGVRLDTLSQPQGEVTSVAFTPDGDHVIAAGRDKRIALWKLASLDAPAINPLVRAVFAHETPIVAFALAADGRRLMTTAEDRSLKSWSVPDLAIERESPRQPDLVAALVPAAAGRFLLGRMDGSLDVVDVAGTDGTPRALADRDGPRTSGARDGRSAADGTAVSLAETEPNDSARQAEPVAVPATITAAIGGSGDADCFRFEATAGQPVLLEVAAAKAVPASKLDSRLEVLDAAGRPVEQVVLQAVRDSWFTFRGKDSSGVDDFRIQGWEEMELDQYLYANGEVVKLWLYPRGPDSGFLVYPGSGTRHTFFHTSAVTHALGEPAWIVEPLPRGATPVPNGLPVFRVFHENDDEATRRLGTDSQLTFTPPVDGAYVARVTDVRGFGGPADFHYTLSIRAPRPSFTVAVGGKDPQVSPGSAKEITLTATRIEGFDGRIRIEVENLPAGFTFHGPVEIEAGQHEAIGVLSAAVDATAPDAPADEAVKVRAIGVVAGAETVLDLGTLGDIQLAEKPKLTVEILPGADAAVVQQVPGEPLEFTIRPGQTISAKVKVERHDFPGRVEFGKDGAGRNLPHGVFIDNLGLNGLLVVEGQDEREFFITAAPKAAPGRRLFHLRTTQNNGQASLPAVINVLPPRR
jgi:WD40 repeat protein/mono/diheme cytochrome c family protein